MQLSSMPCLPEFFKKLAFAATPGLAESALQGAVGGLVVGDALPLHQDVLGRADEPRASIASPAPQRPQQLLIPSGQSGPSALREKRLTRFVDGVADKLPGLVGVPLLGRVGEAITAQVKLVLDRGDVLLPALAVSQTPHDRVAIEAPALARRGHIEHAIVEDGDDRPVVLAKGRGLQLQLIAKARIGATRHEHGAPTDGGADKVDAALRDTVNVGVEGGRGRHEGVDRAQALLRERLPKDRAGGGLQLGVVNADLLIAKERECMPCKRLLPKAPIEVEEQDRRASRWQLANDALPPPCEIRRDGLLPGRRCAARIVQGEDADVQL